MNKEAKKTVRMIVNRNFHCSSCDERDYCKFWKGDNPSFDCGECTADEFADGVFATLKHLGSIHWNEAMYVITGSEKEDKE